jgi:rhomboid protease GluP
MRQKPLPKLRPASIPCPSCRKLISANAPECIHCGLKQPGVYSKVPILGDLIRGRLSFVDGIILVCFVLYALGIALNLPQALSFGGIFGTLSPTNEALYKLGMGGSIPWQQGRWWTLITATYLHGGVLHILFNMLWLRRTGHWVEELFGASRFLIIYTLAGLLGSVASTLAGTAFFVGASGAVFGLFGALIFYGRQRGGTFGSAIFKQTAFLAGISFVLGLVMPGVDNWGHLGGFIGGLLAGIWLSYEEKKRQTLGMHITAALVLALVILSFGLMLVSFFRA